MFGKVVNPTLIVLILTGIYNATWYLPSIGALTSYPGTILLLKMVLVVILVALVYLHNVYFGKKIVELAAQRRLTELKQLRRMSRIVSATNLSLMTLILLLAAMMQIPPAGRQGQVPST